MVIVNDYLSAVAESGLTHEQIAQRAGLSRRAISALLNQQDDARLSTLQALASVLGRVLQLGRAEAAPALALTDQELLQVALRRAEAAQEPSAQARLARLLGRDRAAITRALDGGELGAGARRRLLEHLADPAGHPLPQAAARGRPKKTWEEADESAR